MTLLKVTESQLPKLKTVPQNDFMTNAKYLGDIPFNKYGAYELLYFTQKNKEELNSKNAKETNIYSDFVETVFGGNTANLGHIPKPRNRFIIFKTLLNYHVNKQRLKFNKDISKKKNTRFSELSFVTEIISKIWAALPENGKRYFEYLEALEDNLQQNIYPNFKASKKTHLKPGHVENVFKTENFRKSDKNNKGLRSSNIQLYKKDVNILLNKFKKKESLGYKTSSYDFKEFKIMKVKLEEVVEKQKNKYKALKKMQYCSRFSSKTKKLPPQKKSNKALSTRQNKPRINKRKELALPDSYSQNVDLMIDFKSTASKVYNEQVVFENNKYLPSDNHEELINIEKISSRDTDSFNEYIRPINYSLCTPLVNDKSKSNDHIDPYFLG